MNIRYDLLSSIERLVLLENSIKDKLNDYGEYHRWFEQIFQIRLLQKIFDVKEICVDEEYKDKETIFTDNKKKKIKEYIMHCIEKLMIVFVCEYKGNKMFVQCKCDQMTKYFRKVAFTSYIDDDLTQPQYNYVLNFTIQNKEYTGSISIQMPQSDQMIDSSIVEDNIRQIKKHLDSTIDKFKAYENNKDILENM